MKLLCGAYYDDSRYMFCWDNGIPEIKFHDLRHTNEILLQMIFYLCKRLINSSTKSKNTHKKRLKHLL